MFADGTLMAIFLFETLMFLLIPALIILLIYCIFLAIKALKIYIRKINRWHLGAISPFCL